MAGSNGGGRGGGRPRRRRGRGDGGCHQRPDGLWVASASRGFDAEGRRVRPVAYGRTKAEAQAKLAGKLAAPAGPAGAAGVTVGEFLKLWLAATKDSVEFGTWAPRESRCRLYVEPEIGGVPLAGLDAARVQAFYAKMLADGLSSATRRATANALVTALNYAVSPLKLIPHNPARDVPKPRHRSREMRALSPEEAARFVGASRGTWNHALFLFLVDSGCRPGEAFALRWTDVDWAAGSVSVRRSEQMVSGRGERRRGVKDTKTAGSRRLIFLTPPTLRALSGHRGAVRARGFDAEGGLAFPNTKGGVQTRSVVRESWLLPTLAAAGLPAIRLYDLRHTSATLLLAAGVDAKLVAQRLGHSTPALTASLYQHATPSMGRYSAQRLAAVLCPDGPGAGDTVAKPVANAAHGSEQPRTNADGTDSPQLPAPQGDGGGVRPDAAGRGRA